MSTDSTPDRGTATLGWLGTGRMGYEMAIRLLNSGHELAVWNRTRDKAEPLASLGATIVGDVTDLADRDIVFSILSSSDVFVEVMLGEGGLLTGETTPSLVVDHSTISAEAAEHVRREAAKVDCQVLSAPVCGSPKTVKAGRMSSVVSGDRDAFERARPYLETVARSVTYVGEGEVARLVKICHNLMLGAISQILSETTVLAQKAGVSRTDYLTFINNSPMGSMFSGYKTPAMVTLDWTPSFTSHLLRKDLELGLGAAKAMDVPLPVTATVHQRVMDLIGHGFGDVDFISLLELEARGAGLELEPEPGEGVTDGLTPLDDLSARRP